MSRNDDESAGLRLVFALAAIGICAVGFIVLIASILLPAAGILIVLFMMAAFIATHYLLWGRWLVKMLPREDENDPA